MPSVLQRLRRSPSADRGAAAVEFALLLPIFVMLVFGCITAGTAYWKHISDVQGARDAARYGSTLPFAAASTDSVCGNPGILVTVWLDCVRDVAVSQSAMWRTTSDVTSIDDGYVCVAYILHDTTNPSDTGTVPTTRTTVGSPKATDPAQPATGSSAGGCYDDGLHENRVQVVIARSASFNAIFFGRTWRMTTQVSIPYERGAP